MDKRIFVIEDEEDIAELVRFNLSLEGYGVSTFSTGEEGAYAVATDVPDLILLDLMLPGKSGLEVLKEVRGNPKTQDIPVIIVSAKGEEGDIVKGLELGADDYITKPFSPKILSARVKTCIRRTKTEKEEQGEIINNGMRIHRGRHEVKVEGEEIKLTNSEFQILCYLAQRPGWVFTRTQIVDAIRGENYAVTDRSIDFQMVGLRKKLGEAGSLIETIRGVGYRFREL